MADLAPATLQYGALGILLAVLVGGYLLAKTFLEHMFQQNEAQFDFVKKQIESANAERTGHIDAWHSALKDSVASQVRVVEAMAQVNKTLAASNAQSIEVLSYLKKLNGK